MRAVLLLAAVGCYAPELPTGAPCTTTSECPAPLVCDQGRCTREGGAPDDGAPDDGTVDTFFSIDADPSCQCVDAGTIACGGGAPTTCALGCVAEAAGARCGVIIPSNGVPVDLQGVAGTITIDAVTTFDTETGQISGGLTRAAGEGVAGGIRFERRTSMSAPLGVFTLHELNVSSGGVVQFAGARAAVFVVGTTATIGGTIDGSGGCYGTDRACPGPGGGTGGAYGGAATGCGPGGAGQSDPVQATGADAGGGGGGGGAIGGAGGDAGMFAAGAGGPACLATTLEPLLGGSGGGGGGPGASMPPPGGGGGGALQLTALERILITGDITMGGAGGSAGLGAGTNAGAGSGGGAGGAILLEAPDVELAQNGTLAANGGGGGGGGANNNSGQPGQNGRTSASTASGGSGTLANQRGAAGGANTTAAGSANDVGGLNNAGGGGGAVGRIYVRAVQAVLDGTHSPPAGTGTPSGQ